MRSWLSVLRLVLLLWRRRRLPKFGAVLAATVVIWLAARHPAGDGRASGFLSLAEAMEALVFVLAALGTLLGSVAIAEDSQRGALRSLLVRPIRASSVLLAHAAVLGGYLLLLYGAGVLLGYAAAAAAAGFQPVTLDGYEVVAAADLHRYTERLVLLPLAPLLAAPMLGLFFSATQRDTATAVALSFLFLFAPVVVQGLARDLPLGGPLQAALEPVGILNEIARGVTIDAGTVDSGELARRAVQEGLLWVGVPLLLGALIINRRESVA